MTTSIVIPNWNGAGKLRRHLPDVLAAAKSNQVKEVIVVDDGSTDESVDILKTDFPEVSLIIKKKNSGFSSTVNLGVSHAQGDLVFLLNSDAHPKNDFLKYLLPYFKDKNVFSVGCNTGGSWTWAEFKNGFSWHHQATDESLDKTKAHPTLWASGGSALFRKSIWEELGGLDTLFDPFYEEDMDLGYRAIKRGFINLWESRSIVEHYHEKGVIESNFDRSRVALTAQRNQLIFIWKNITSEKLMNAHKKALLKMLIRHPGYWSVFLRALWLLPQILEKRRIEKAKAKLTDEEILEIFKV